MKNISLINNGSQFTPLVHYFEPPQLEVVHLRFFFTYIKHGSY